MVMSPRPAEECERVVMWDILIGDKVFKVTEPYISISSEAVNEAG
jgi:hypothetical protein